MREMSAERADSQQPVPAAAEVAPPPASQPAPPATKTRERPAPERVDELPSYRVLLHNDDKSDMIYVVETLCELTPLTPQKAAHVMLEAHNTGVALVLLTHKERAELYVDQFMSKQLTVTIEPV